MQGASGRSSSTARCSLQAVGSRAAYPRRKDATAACAPKTQGLVSGLFCIFDEVSLQCVLHCVYRHVPMSIHALKEIQRQSAYLCLLLSPHPGTTVRYE